MDKRHNLCSELLSIENELEFCKENSLNTDDVLKRKKEINRQLAGLRKNEPDNQHQSDQ